MADFNSAFRDNSPAAVQARTKVQNRQNVLQMKLMGQAHPTGLTNNLLKLFEARPPLEFKPPPERRKCQPYTGMAQFVEKFAEPGDPEYAPPPKEVELPSQRRARIHKLRLEKGEQKAAEELKKYDPQNDPNVSGDPYKTLFVARLNYETNESKIKREFEAYGPIKRVRMITDKETNKPRGYAFIEYVHTRDMKSAYKQADGRKLDNRRVLVDVERGRTVPNWRPRRLGGGLGTTRVGGEEVNQKYSGREQQSGPSKSEEPRVREDRHLERSREKSRERGRDREREKSHERPRERDTREDRHHRDRERDRNRDKEKDRGRDRERTRDRDGGRDRERDRGRDKDRHRDREREKVKDRDYEAGEDDRGRSRDRGYDYDNLDAKHDSDRRGEKKNNYDHAALEEEGAWNDIPDQKHMLADPGAEKYDPYEHHGGYDAPEDHDRYNRERDYDRYDQMEVDNHRYDSRERRKRSVSREYEH
uniref:RRM domain-containing protein n=1 Tax=Kalanchoe fedtschenkoi TaxID=63787 RepID=A0A7N0UC27_KALFE